jgi:hypothetical protein
MSTVILALRVPSGGWATTLCFAKFFDIRDNRRRDSDLRVVGILSPTSLARAKSTFKYRVARWYAQRKGCDELLRVVGRGEG